LMATGVVPAKLRRFSTLCWISTVVKVVFATRREAPGAIPMNRKGRPAVRNPLPAAIPADSLVKYTLNPQGEIAAVWILSAQEARR